MTAIENDHDADPRIVFCTRCTWWEHISRAITKEPGGIPLCAACECSLWQESSEEAWLAAADDYAKRNNDPEYGWFIRWAKGKSYRDYQVARKVFNNLTLKERKAHAPA